MASSQLMHSDICGCNAITMEEPETLSLFDIAHTSTESRIFEVIADDVAIGLNDSGISTLYCSERYWETLAGDEDIVSVLDVNPSGLSATSFSSDNDRDGFTLYLPPQRRLSLLTVGTVCQSPMQRQPVNVPRQSPLQYQPRQQGAFPGSTPRQYPDVGQPSCSPMPSRQRRLSLNAIGRTVYHTPKVQKRKSLAAPGWLR